MKALIVRDKKAGRLWAKYNGNFYSFRKIRDVEYIAVNDYVGREMEIALYFYEMNTSNGVIPTGVGVELHNIPWSSENPSEEILEQLKHIDI